MTPIPPPRGAATLALHLLLGVLAVTAAAPACSQTAAAAAPTPALEAGDDVTRELIDLLTASGAIKPTDASRLLDKLKSQIAARRAAPPPATWGTPLPAGTNASAVDAKGSVRVTYVPESEKQRIRDEVKREVIAQAKAEHWAQPNTFPEWISRLTFDGDFRARGEVDLYADNNAPFINFQAINSGNPYNTALQGGAAPPFINTDRNRTQPRVRARLGLTADVAEGLTAGFRFATGNTTNPVSTNQTLGSDFNKLSLTVDRAYLQYRPNDSLEATIGRLPNPWLSTPLVWDEDLNFDGLALKLQPAFGSGLFGDMKPYLTLGAFSVYNSAFDFPSTSMTKARSRDKWLFALQAGASGQIGSGLAMNAALAYYDFYNVAGKPSSPCLAKLASDVCDTDNSRPGFVQKGNTLFPIRTLLVDSTQAFPPQYQYFGLASRFRLLDLTAQADWSLGGTNHLIATADVVRNLGYSRSRVLSRGPANNFDANNQYDGGGTGLLVNLQLGTPAPAAAGQWNLGLGYRRIDSDAVVDGFNDSDFHLGGTNAKGYTLQGALGVAKNAWVSLRWLSATEVSGPPLAIDVLQLDLSARF